MTPNSDRARITRRVRMTTHSIWTIKPAATQIDWFDRDAKGLALRVAPSGERVWYFRYRFNGHGRRLKIGDCTDKFGLHAARARAGDLRAELAAGKDPAAARDAARRGEILTVKQFAPLYVALYAKGHKKPKTVAEEARWIAKYLVPKWSARPVASITSTDVAALVDRIVADGKKTLANRVQMLISSMWRYAVSRGDAASNPCYRMEKRGGVETPGERVLTDEEIRALFGELDARPGPSSEAIRLRILTGQRGAEVHGMRWADLQWDGDARAIWTIPGSMTKNGQPHRLPIVGEALEIVKRLEAAQDDKTEPRVFPGLDHYARDLRKRRKIHGGAYRWHDLRRTFTTRLAELGIREELLDRLLNHARRGVTATVYNQHQYDADKRTALECWDRELARILANAPHAGAAVVPLRPFRR
jgi:integrase